MNRATLTVLAIPLGYLTGSLLYLLCRLAQVTNPVVVLTVCVVSGAALWWLTRREIQGVLALRGLRRDDWVPLASLAILVLVIVGPVFAHVGLRTPQGRAYRAYFIADLFAHMSVVGELIKSASPPVNPFLPSESLPYYWAYFSLPTLFAQLEPSLIVDRGLLLTAVIAALVFMSVGYLVARNLGAGPWGTFTGWAVVLVASSFEGVYLIVEQARLGRFPWAFRDLNIDGLTRWRWDVPPTDGLHRAMWYTPQHEMALTCGLLVVLVASMRRPERSVARGVFEGLLLGAALTFSSFNGLILVAAYGVAELWRAAIDRDEPLLRWVLGRADAAVIVLGCMGLTLALQMIQRMPNAFIWGLNPYMRRGPTTYVALSFGPALVLGALGLPTLRKESPHAVRVLSVLTAACVFLLLFFEVRGHRNTYVPFRTGQFFFIILGLMLACAVQASTAWRPVARRLFVALLLVGSCAALPTVAFDWYNARDITNVRMNPGGFPWTVHISDDDVRATHWITRNLPDDAVVAIEPAAHGRATWALIPAFAERRMPVGLGLFEPNPTRFEAQMRQVDQLFRTGNLEEAAQLCWQLRVGFVYVGPAERSRHGAALTDFAAAPQYFRSAYRHGSVQIWRVIGTPHS